MPDTARVVPHPDGGWQVLINGESIFRATAQKEVVKWARHTYLAPRGGGQLETMGLDGTVRRVDNVPPQRTKIPATASASANGYTPDSVCISDTEQDMFTEDQLVLDLERDDRLERYTLIHAVQQEVCRSNGLQDIIDHIDNQAAQAKGNLSIVFRGADFAMSRSTRYKPGQRVTKAGLYLAVHVGTTVYAGELAVFSRRDILPDDNLDYEWLYAFPGGLTQTQSD